MPKIYSFAFVALHEQTTTGKGEEDCTWKGKTFQDACVADSVCGPSGTCGARTVAPVMKPDPLG